MAFSPSKFLILLVPRLVFDSSKQLDTSVGCRFIIIKTDLLMKPVLYGALLFALSAAFSACQKDPCPNPPTNFAYYSDYFVFVADDGGAPLSIPLDIDWRPTATGFEQTFKSWHGTSAPWPINYYVREVASTPCEVPQEPWEHSSDADFQFDATARTIASTLPNGTTVGLTIPDKSDWVPMPSNNAVRLYAFQTTATVNAATRSGWTIYGRMRRETNNNSGSSSAFGAFYWMPIVAGGNLYYFLDHNGEQAACRWQAQGGTVTADTLSAFTFQILSTAPDTTSGRTAVAEQLRIAAPAWGVDFTLNSTGHQVGYGPAFPKGLGLYRQSLLEPAPSSVTSGYGMLELVLEED